MKKIIIDVSSWQGVINWEKAKPYISGAIIRMGYGTNSTSNDDKYFSRNVSECERLGIPWGAYLYSYADTQSKIQSEIAHAKRLMKNKKPQLPVYFDSEQKGTEKKAAAFAEQFCKEMRIAGFKAGVYASASWYRSFLKGKIHPDSLWIAAYGSNDGKAHGMPDVGEDVWQYTSKGKVPGINGNVDMNYYYNGSELTSTIPAKEEKLAVDGIGGAKTITRWQKIMKSKYIDGIVSGQYKENAKYFPAITSVNWTEDGSELVKLVQKKLKISVDGYWGKKTTIALNEYLGMKNKDVFDKDSVKALQKKLNTGKF